MNARQRKFAHEYVRLKFNGVRAVYAAGYNQGYNAARVTASRLLTMPNVTSAIESHINRSKMSADEVLENLSEVAKTQTNITESSKLKALELLGKAHKLFTDKVEIEQNSDEIDLGADMVQIAQSLKNNPEFAAKVRERLALREQSEPGSLT